MDRIAFRARIGQLMTDGHALHSHINALMTDLGDDGRSAEWATLYNVMMSVGVANRIMYDSVQPPPSGLADPAPKLTHNHDIDDEPVPGQSAAPSPYMCRACEAETGDPYAFFAAADV